MAKIIAFHTLHDANVCVCEGGRLLAVLELERLFDVRYFCSAPKKTRFTEQWAKAIELITKYTGISQFDVGIFSWVMPTQQEVLKNLVHAEKWVYVDHHLSHAALGFYDSPFQRALILSYDGGGNDGTFNVYLGDRVKGIQHKEWVGLNLGTPYRQVATAMPEVTREKRDPEEVSAYMRCVMGYAALGSVREEWLPAMKEYYEKFVTPLTSLYTLGEKLDLCLEANSLEEKEARDLAATSQYMFGEQLSKQIEARLDLMKHENVDGIVLTGGCALNVHANQLLVERYNYPVHVPAAPNDCGISVGSAWIVQPPLERWPVQYAGMPCWDSGMLNHLVEARNAKPISIPQVAQMLLEGAIIAVVRGRQEFGPRALGHRSMLCYPNKAELKEKLNRLKSREWFRPLCPSVAVESVPKLFTGRKYNHQESGQSENANEDIADCCQEICIHSDSEDPMDWVPASPYMSFAPYLKQEAKQMFPAIAHFDGTARLQTVAASDDEWYHSLLTEVANNNGGYGILLNTSFNVKGKPILNRLSTALDVLDNSPEGTFDSLIIEDWLFEPQRKS